MPVRVVVITDRRMFASEEIAGRVAAILATCRPGSVAIQVREKDLDGGPLMRLVREVVEVAAPAGAPVWVNDRLDVAAIAGVHGVHLPERGLAIADARAALTAVRKRLAIGCSRHTAIAAAQAARDGADAIQIGPIWDTPGKDRAAGVELIEACGRIARGKPLIAVGGIDRPERARAAAAAGAEAVAVIRAAWHGAIDTISALVEAVESGAASRSLA